MELLILRAGNLLAISPDGQSACPDEVVQLLAPEMQYTHKQFNYGASAHDPVSGYKSRFTFSTRYLYQLDDLGRYCCQAGYYARVVSMLQARGYTLKYLDVSPERERPDCYDTHWDEVRNTFDFRPRQEEFLTNMTNATCGLFNATMGFGKTYLMAMIAVLYLKAKIDIIVKDADIVDKLRRHLIKYIPNVGLIKASTRKPGRVTVVSAGSIHHADGTADIVLGEEAHQLLAPTFSKKIGQIYRYSRNFAFTGTPEGRLDGTDAKMESLFGPEIFKLTYQQAVELGLVVPIRVEWLPCRMLTNPTKGKTTDTAKKRHGIWRNKVRNQLIADHVRKDDPNDQTLILLESIEHAIFLGRLLPEFEICYGSIDPKKLQQYRQWELVPQHYVGVTPDIRERMRCAFEDGTLKKVIATDVWSTGVDFPQLTHLFRADERDSAILSGQGPARVSRIHAESNKKFGRVTDIVDMFDDRLRGKSMTRRRAYKRFGWEQIWPDQQMSLI